MQKLKHADEYVNDFLVLLADSPEGISIQELAENLGVHRVTAGRYAKTALLEGNAHRVEAGPSERWRGRVLYVPSDALLDRLTAPENGETAKTEEREEPNPQMLPENGTRTTLHSRPKIGRKEFALIARAFDLEPIEALEEAEVVTRDMLVQAIRFFSGKDLFPALVDSGLVTDEVMAKTIRTIARR